MRNYVEINNLLNKCCILRSPILPLRSSFMYGMVLIAAKPLGDDDELYVDYRLNPAAELPTWYGNTGRDSNN